MDPRAVVRIDPDVHLAVKLRAVQMKITLGEAVTLACREWVERKERAR